MTAPLEPPHDIDLPPLSTFPDAQLMPSGDYDAVLFDQLDLSAQDASGARFLDCALAGCRADELLLKRSRLVDSVARDLQATTLDASESVWRDALVAGGRIGALTAHGVQLTRVRFRHVKTDFVNLRDARLQEVVFEDCVLGEVDLSRAELSDVAFPGSRVDDLQLAGARLQRVDLQRAELHRISGVDHLAGATVSPAQLLDLAPLLAEHLGITVGPGDT